MAWTVKSVGLLFSHTGTGMQGADEAVFVLAPILLLLNQDPLLCRGLTPERRYFPPVCAATLFLAANAVAAAVLKRNASSQHIPTAEGVEVLGAGYLVRSLALLVATLPNLFILLRVSLACPKQRTGAV